MSAWNFVRKSFYQDSVTLMRLTRDMEALPGVQRATAMMGTPSNRALLKEAGLLTAEGDAAGPTDLVIAVAADTREAAEAARAAAEAALTTRRAATAARAAQRPRTLESALKALPGATLALISVPGSYAAAEARKALAAGLHVMLFSDNVPLADEVALKRLARERGLFLMGPDCGTAIVNGVPLGFANAVPRGRIGVAAASGTGLQAVTCHVAAAGEGISQAIGVGGRDLSDEVGGLTMEQALDALAADPATSVICVLGKPPGPSTAKKVRAWIDRLGKPAVVHFLGDAAASTTPSLEDAALAAVALARGATHTPAEFTLPPDAVSRLVENAARALSPGQKFVRGVYSGGTLAYEAIGILKARLADVASGVTGGGGGHRLVDLGADVFTVGRPHPMIDGTVRREWIEKEGADPATALLLLDVVLGWGAHADPAGEILPAIHNARRAAKAAGRGLAVVAAVCGAPGDPQGLAAQTAALEAAGVIVLPSNAQAARLAALVVAPRR